VTDEEDQRVEEMEDGLYEGGCGRQRGEQGGSGRRGFWRETLKRDKVEEQGGVEVKKKEEREGGSNQGETEMVVKKKERGGGGRGGGAGRVLLVH
jgi:hypothetical protein